MNSSIFLEQLDELHIQLEEIWPNGREAVCCAKDGHHFTLKGFSRPVSIGRVEAYILYNISKRFSVKRAFEIGTGFGYSSLWLAAAIVANYGNYGWLGSIDNQSEGELGNIGLEFARAAAQSLGISPVTHYFVGTSPIDLPKVISAPLDLVFIDGHHHGKQPAADYLGVRPFLASDSLLLWHDIQARYDVEQGVGTAIKDGWSIITFPTSCRLGVCYCSMKGWEAAMEAFASAQQLKLL